MVLMLLVLFLGMLVALMAAQGSVPEPWPPIQKFSVATHHFVSSHPQFFCSTPSQGRLEV